MARHRAAVLGSPISHSLSPALHRAAYAALDLDWEYSAIDVDVAHLHGFMSGMDESWAGLSLTMPLKEAVIDLLASVDEVAAMLRSVNTVLPGVGGWRGTNTDVYGMVQAIRETAGPGFVATTATVIGAGATARSSVAALAQLGVERLTVCARRAEAAVEVAALAATFGVTASVAHLGPDPELARADIFVSTLPGDIAEPWSALAGSTGGVLLDASYFPWPTPLAAAWQGPIASGRDMLLWQAVEQVRLMTGSTPPVAAMAAALPD